MRQTDEEFNSSSKMIILYPEDASVLYSHQDEFTNDLLTTLNCYILTPICIVGILSNVSALYLFNRPPYVVSGVAVYLNTVLVLDILQLFFTAVMTTPYFCEYALADETQSFHEYCLFYYRYVGYLVSRLVSVVDTGQVWSLSALAVHRYWKISQPMKSLATDTPKRALKVLFILFSLDLIFRLPMFYELKISKHPNLNISIVSENVRLGRNRFYNIVYYLILNTTFYNVVPFVLLAFTSFLTMNSLIGVRRYAIKPLSQAQFVVRIHTSLSRRKNGELKATLSICVMTILFLLFHSLFIYEVVQRYRVYVHEVIGTNLHIISDLNTILSMTSSTLNAFVYIAITNRCKKHLEFKRQKYVRFKSRLISSTRTLSSSYDFDQVSILNGNAGTLHRPKMKKANSCATMCSTDV